MTSLRDDCKCGHDRSSHYRDAAVAPVVWCNCLAMRCDCKRFVPYDAPSSPALPPRPGHHLKACLCYYCKPHQSPVKISIGSVKIEDDEIDEDPPPTPRFWGFP